MVSPNFVAAVKDFQHKHLYWCEKLAITKDWAVDIKTKPFGYPEDALACVLSEVEYRAWIWFNTDCQWNDVNKNLDVERVKEEALRVVMSFKFKELGASYLDDDQWDRIVTAGVKEYKRWVKRPRAFDLKAFEQDIIKTYNLGPNAGVLHPGGLVDEEGFDRMVEAAGGEDVLIAKLEAERLKGIK